MCDEIASVDIDALQRHRNLEDLLAVAHVG